MIEPSDEADYSMRRAREEAHRALTAERPEVAAAHHALSVLHSARAREVRAMMPAVGARG